MYFNIWKSQIANLKDLNWTSFVYKFLKAIEPVHMQFSYISLIKITTQWLNMKYEIKIRVLKYSIILSIKNIDISHLYWHRHFANYYNAFKTLSTAKFKRIVTV